MNLRNASLFLLLASVVGVTAARADDGVSAVLEGRYAAMKNCMAAHDARAIAALLAPDFISVDVNGQTEDGARMIQEVIALPTDPNKTSRTTLQSVQVSGDTAVVVQRYDMKTTKISPDGASRNTELVTVSTDTWVKADQTWLIRRTVTEQLDYYVNGQPAAHKVRAGS